MIPLLAMGTSVRDSRRRLVGIEGMRALAASSVLVYHVWLYGDPSGRSVPLGAATKIFDNLRAGVTLFFVLSGFLLFRPYVAAALRGRPMPSLGAYLRNRALRILPAYWTILLFVALFLEHVLIERPHQLLANAAFVQNYVPSFAAGAGIVPAWSLAIEAVFYLCVPALGGAAIVLARGARLSPVAAAWIPVATMIAIGFGAKILERSIHLGTVFQLSFLMRADWFAAGMALAIVYVRWEDGMLLPRRWRPVAAVTALGLVLLATKLFYRGTLNFTEYQTPIALACGLVLALVVFAPPTSKLLVVLQHRAIVAVGLGSYSLFLWHDPLLRAVRNAGLTFDGAAGFVPNLLIVAAMAGVASALTYRFVEKPALARKRTWQSPEAAGAVEAEPVGSLEESDLKPEPAAPAVSASLRGAG